MDGTSSLTVGQERVINPRYARVSALGVPLMDTDFRITLKYLGPSGRNALFDMNIQTSKQVPEMVISKLFNTPRHRELGWSDKKKKSFLFHVPHRRIQHILFPVQHNRCHGPVDLVERVCQDLCSREGIERIADIQ